MLKRLLLLAGLLSLVSGPSLAAGTVPGISMTQQLDSLGNPLNGGKLYLIQAGTTSTPQSCYQDSGLTIPWPNPITLDSAGRVPQLFCADGSIKIRLTNSAGVQQLVQDNLLVVGPSGGGGGGGTVDPTTILATGDMKLVYGTGVLSGFVRANGRTIGSATSGATERANADCQSLFEYLWGADANLAVSGGRGASAAADWTANKTIQLPDARGAALANLDDMGNSTRGTFVGVTFGSGNATTLGSYLGTARQTLTTANLPPYTPSGTVNPGTANIWNTTDSVQAAGTSAVVKTLNGSGIGTNTVLPTSGYSFTGNAQGGTSTPFDTISPFLLITTYIKL
jgi:hypothetical protein